MLRPSEKQLTLAHWWHRPATNDMDGIIADGSIRSGKTYAMIVGFLTWSRSEFKGQAFIIAGKTVGSLKRNVIRPMLTLLRQMGWKCRYNRSEGYIETGGNTYYLFGAGNESSQDVLQGITAAGCLADEVALFPKSFVDQMVGRCSVEGSKLWFNCNPSYPGHFFKKEWVDKANEKKLIHLHFMMEDNPSLSGKIRERYERMFIGVFYDRYIRGLWVQAEGIIYQMYKDALEGPLEGRFTDWCISLDYGTLNPFAGQKWAFDGNVWHCVGEYHHSGRETGSNKTDADYLEDMVRFTEGIPEPVTVIVDPSAASFITALRRCNSRRFHVIPADNDVIVGINDTAVCLKDGTIKVSTDCRRTIEEFESYVWEDNEACDRPVKMNDHHMDAIRYFVRTKKLAIRSEGYQPVF